MWLQILAFTDAPVVGADVCVSAHGVLLVEAKAATNKYGAFSAEVPRHLSSFRVTDPNSILQASLEAAALDVASEGVKAAPI